MHKGSMELKTMMGLLEWVLDIELSDDTKDFVDTLIDTLKIPNLTT